MRKAFAPDSEKRIYRKMKGSVMICTEKDGQGTFSKKRRGKYVMKERLLTVLTAIVIGLLGEAAAGEEQYAHIQPFSEGLAAVQNADGFWGYIDQTGETVIPCEWSEAGTFRNGIASVCRNHLYGCIDRSGKVTVPCVWHGYGPMTFSEGLAGVEDREGRGGFINPAGEVVIPNEWEGPFAPQFSEGLAAVEKDGLMGYIDRTGKIVIPLQYLYASDFSHGFARVQDEKGLLFIDKTGRAAFPEIPRATGADSFREDGTAYLEFPDDTGIFIDTKGRTVCSLSDEYRFRSSFREGRAGIAKRNEKGEWKDCEGYIDRTGAIVIPMNLKSSQSKFRNGRACVWNGLTEKNERRYGVIDPDGREIYPFTLDEKVVFEGPVAAAVQDGRAGAISLDGKTVVPFAFDEVRVGDGIILCLRDGRISLYDYGGKKI